VWTVHYVPSGFEGNQYCLCVHPHVSLAKEMGFQTLTGEIQSPLVMS